MSITIALGVLFILALLWMRAIDREHDANSALKQREAGKAELERIEADEAVDRWERDYHRELDRIKAREYHDAYMSDVGANRRVR